MVALDWTILAGYIGAMMLLSLWLSRRQEGTSDYYLGGRRLGYGAVGISILATQSSAISFISIPAFVATRPDGGLRFLQYELALPAAMAALALFIVPALRASQSVTIYGLLEERFDRPVRKAVAALFLLGRGLATGVALYATGLVLSACLQTPLWLNLLLVGALTTVYDLLGGMTAVVYSDVVQMAVLTIALVVCITTVSGGPEGFAAMWSAFPAERMDAFASSARGGDSLLSYIIGGLFLYVSYYGCDQSQAQRLLSTPSVADSQRALLFNGLARFPLIAGYCALGVAAHGALGADNVLRASVAAGPPDALVPTLLRSALPDGIRGLVFAGLLAAAMSSLDSALNALSASTAKDFGPEYGQEDGEDAHLQLRKARLITLAWGAAITAFSFVVGDISETVIEAINKVGSAIYGPVLAVFLLAVSALPLRGHAVLSGLFAGFFANVALWLWVPWVHFLWWNAIGTMITLAVALGLAHLDPGGRPRILPPKTAPKTATVGDDPLPKPQTLALLGAASTVILVVMSWLSP